MSTQTIERNYRKNPHTARFLQTFHSGIGSNGRNYRDDAAALATEAAQDADLLNLVPDVADLRSDAQRKLIDRLVAQITELDAETGSKARAYTDGMTEHGKWTPGYTGTASAWISRMIAKEKELRAAAVKAPAAPVPAVEDGRYAVEEDGVLKFFKVKNGHCAGFVFLDIQASDDWHAIRDLGRIRKVVALIAEDPQAAMIRYGHELGECGRCGKLLTDEASRAAGIGPICRGRM